MTRRLNQFEVNSICFRYGFTPHCGRQLGRGQHKGRSRLYAARCDRLVTWVARRHRGSSDVTRSLFLTCISQSRSALHPEYFFAVGPPPWPTFTTSSSGYITFLHPISHLNVSIVFLTRCDVRRGKRRDIRAMGGVDHLAYDQVAWIEQHKRGKRHTFHHFLVASLFPIWAMSPS